MEIFYYINLALAVAACVLYLRKFFTESKIRLYFLIFAIDSLLIAGVYFFLAIGFFIEPYIIRMCFTLLLITFLTSYFISSVRYKGC